MKRQNQAGFTLIETTLVFAIVAILAALVLPRTFLDLNRNELNLATQQLALSLRQAQSFALNGEGDEDWGVATRDGSIILFKGDDFSLRDPDYDRSVDFSDNLIWVGTTDFVFLKMSGLPISEGVLVLSNTDGVSKTITVNSKGLVEY